MRRRKLAFRAVNRRGEPGYQPDMQRHHLLPCQLLRTSGLRRMLGSLGCEDLGFDDFRRNGLLLPATISAALRVGLPMHRGPHRDYNALVAERVGQIEGHWARQVCTDAAIANATAAMRIALLQDALRRRLLAAGQSRLRLSRKDPFRPGQDFTELDAMADALWAGTALGN